MPPCWSFIITGSTSSSVSTRSPMTIEDGPFLPKATHEPKASPALISTPSSETCKSLRGRPNLITFPGCICPGRPIASSTAFQSEVACASALPMLNAHRMEPANIKIKVRFAGLLLLENCKFITSPVLEKVANGYAANSTPLKGRLLRFLEHQCSCCHVLQGHPGAVKNDRFFIGNASRLSARDDLSQLGMNVRPFHHSGFQCVVKIPDACALLQDVNHDLGTPHQLRLKFLLFRIVGSDRRDESSGLNVLTL